MKCGWNNWINGRRRKADWLKRSDLGSEAFAAQRNWQRGGGGSESRKDERACFVRAEGASSDGWLGVDGWKVQGADVKAGAMASEWGRVEEGSAVLEVGK